MKATARIDRDFSGQEASYQDAINQALLEAQVAISEIVDDSTEAIIDRINKVWTFGGDC